MPFHAAPASLFRAALAAASLFCALPALAQQAAPRSDAERMQAREEIAALRQQARQLRAEAYEQFGVAEKQCLQKFLANDCIDQARRARNDTERQAKELEKKAEKGERDLKTELRAIKAAQREEKARSQEQAAAKRAAQTRLDAEKNTQRQEKQRAKQQPCPCDCPR
jgi:hypothetical protein